jgi:hypothetical protein
VEILMMARLTLIAMALPETFNPVSTDTIVFLDYKEHVYQKIRYPKNSILYTDFRLFSRNIKIFYQNSSELLHEISVPIRDFIILTGRQHMSELTIIGSAF